MDFLPRVYIGTVSKNTVDAVIDFSIEEKVSVGLIPSRRQIDYNSGYVNHWTTSTFKQYVSDKNAPLVTIERDHGGPAQGTIYDSGLISLAHDCVNFDLIHIDPWKEFSPTSIEHGILRTVELIKFCFTINPKICFEIGTEQSIRRLSSDEIALFVDGVVSQLTPDEINAIRYVVIQAGTELLQTTQVGTFNKQAMIDQIKLANERGFLTKEHNGDYQSIDSIRRKFEMGLDAINIAPEFGVVETNTYLESIHTNDLLDDFWKMCFNSGAWCKWVGPDFDPISNRLELIRICGHYMLSTNEFSKIKEAVGNLDEEIKRRMKHKLKELYGC